MKTDWLTSRTTKTTSTIVAYVIVMIGVLGFANFLANRYNKSVDTTSNKRFSLSDQTIKVVKGLKQDVKITLYDQTSKFAGARDLLDRYSNLSSKLTVDFVDPYKKPQIARAAGVKTEGQIFVQTGAKTEEARSLTEEEITGALIRSLKGGERTICSCSGSGEHSFDDTSKSRGFSQLKEVIEKNNYKTRQITLLQGGGETAKDAKAPAAPASFKPEVPKDCTVLLVAGPRFEYVEPVVNALKAYVEGGGHAIFLIDPPLKWGKDEVAENAALTKMLEGWGVTLDKNLVLDLSGIGQLFGLNEVVPLVTTYESHAIVREMKEVATAFPLARSLDVKSVDKSTVEKLLSTSDKSFATTNLSSPEKIAVNPDKDKKGPLTLAAAGTYNTGQQGNQGRFVVVGSSEWAANGFLRFNGNRDLFLNMANWLSQDEDLISIRPKEQEDRRLSLNKAQMTLIFWSSVLLLPLAVVIAGIGVWWRRR